MTWLDIMIVLVLGVGIYGGYKRGVVAEAFDVICLLVGLTVACRVQAPLANTLNSGVLKAWGESWVWGFSFFIVFLPIAVAILTSGFHLDRVTKEQERIPREVSETGGLLIALPKYLILLCLFVAWFNQSWINLDRERGSLRRAPLVQLVRGLNPLAKPFVWLALPTERAKPFIEKGMNKNF